MKNLAFLLLLTTSLNAFAANPLCQGLFSPKVSKTEALAQSWNTDEGMRELNRELQSMGNVKSVYDKKLETRVYFTATGIPDGHGQIPRVDPDAKAVVVFFHGSGTAAGGGVNFTSSMNKLANIGFAAMSFDLPFHAEGPKRDQFNDLNFLMKWVHEVLAPARALGKPIYLVGHSFGPQLIAEYAYTYPHDIAGLALLSPVGFNNVLRKWEKQETGYMHFEGDEVADNTLGGMWADQVSKKFKWEKTNGQGDPTIENPNLRVEVLTGAWEEYAPGPVGGKSGLPSGPNTYSIANAIRPFFKRANIITEPNVGHMIFNKKDANGRDIVSRTIFQMIGVDSRSESELASAYTEYRNARPQWVQLDLLLSQDHFFRAWLASTGQTGLAHGLINSANNEQSLKLMLSYREALKARRKQMGL